ncbi:MAG: ferredoxin-thioredoxin reductase catalytic domain-containing protein [Candidatus Aminicenantaceae bacterium]
MNMIVLTTSVVILDTISSEEAQKISDVNKVEFDKTKFLGAIEKFTENNEFQVNPDKEKVKTLLDGLFNNEQNHGLKYCPYRLITKDFKEDLRFVCPSGFHSVRKTLFTIVIHTVES